MAKLTETIKLHKISDIKSFCFLAQQDHKIRFYSCPILSYIIFQFPRATRSSLFLALIWEVRFECNIVELKASAQICYDVRRINILWKNKS